MEKAYDPKALALMLKDKGLDLAEESVVLVVDVLFDWLEQSAKLSTTPFDDAAMLVAPKVKELVHSLVDKIDGEIG
jgi:hypothetical protein